MGVPTVDYCDVQNGYPGNYNIDEVPLFVNGPSVLGTDSYYLSQIASGDPADSPCVNIGAGWADDYGLDSYTTRRDHIGDTGRVDMGYHYPIMYQLAPADGSQIMCYDSPPVFEWTTGRNDMFRIQFSFNNFTTVVWSSSLLSTTSWTMPNSLWDLAPRNDVVYWRVQRANSGDDPPIIETSEVWSFSKATDGISLIAPPNWSELTDPTTFQWTTGCDNVWRLQLSLYEDFSSVAWQSSNLTSPQYDIAPIWGAIQEDTTIYWRAIEANTGEYTLSIDPSNVWSFRKVSP